MAFLRGVAPRKARGVLTVSAVTYARCKSATDASVRGSGGKIFSLLICASIHVMSRSTYTGVLTLVAVLYLGLCSSFQKYSYFGPAVMRGHDVVVQKSLRVP